MPLTFSTITANINPLLVDGNLDDIDRLLREQVVDSDFAVGNTIGRFKVKRGQFGKVSSAISRTEEIYGYGYESQSNNAGYYEMLGVDRNKFYINGQPSKYGSAIRTMEFLGSPGPSFYYNFQEDGVADPGADVKNRFPSHLCYSYWLTCPNASTKLWIDGPCVVRVKAMYHAMLAINYWGQFVNHGANIAPQTNIHSSWRQNTATLGREMAMRIALVVDTNPILHDDEFANSNPNIKNPDGSTASRRTWEFIEEKSVYAGGTATKNQISGDIALKGNKHYNFSMKFRDAATIGYMAGGTWYDGTYENSVSLSQFNTADGYLEQEMASVGIFEVMWLSTSLHIEVFYGYNGITDNSANIVKAVE